MKNGPFYFLGLSLLPHVAFAASRSGCRRAAAGKR